MWVKTDLKSAGGRNRETFLMIWVMRKSEKGMKGVNGLKKAIKLG